ncbi:MAG: hypothetical protein WAO55_14065 [Candidatus Manganitrophaceae bacterium]
MKTGKSRPVTLFYLMLYGVLGWILFAVWASRASAGGLLDSLMETGERVKNAADHVYSIQQDALKVIQSGMDCISSGPGCEKAWQEQETGFWQRLGERADQMKKDIVREFLPDSVNDAIDLGEGLESTQKKIQGTFDSVSSYIGSPAHSPLNHSRGDRFDGGQTETNSLVTDRDLEGIGGRKPGSSSSSLITDRDLQGIGGQRSGSSASSAITDQDLQGLGAPSASQRAQKRDWGEESARLREDIAGWNKQQLAEQRRRDEVEKQRQAELARQRELQRQAAAKQAYQRELENKQQAGTTHEDSSDSGSGSFFGSILKGAAEGYLMGKYGIPPSSFGSASSGSASSRSRSNPSSSGNGSIDLNGLDSQCPGASGRLSRIFDDATRRADSNSSISGAYRMAERVNRQAADVLGGCPQTPEISAAKREFLQAADQNAEAACQVEANCRPRR